MSKDESKLRAKLRESRRDFLKLAGVGSLAGAAAAVSAEPAKADGADQDGGEGYRETKHVKTYYDLARF
jgi:anaerobic selenocysteine-containing dehydrogenase